MDLKAENVRLIRNENRELQAVIDGEIRAVDRVSLAFPKTTPHRYVGLLDHTGHEIGLIENPDGLDEASRDLLEEELRAAYFVPTILEIRSVASSGSASVWDVLTDEGETSFRIIDREALDGSEAPAILVTDTNGKQYRIPNYWEMDRNSRRAIRDLLPQKILRTRHRKKFW